MSLPIILTQMRCVG